MPASQIPVLEAHLVYAKQIFEADQARGLPPVYLPDALHRKYRSAGRQWAWQWVFPADRLSTDPRSGKQRRHHVSPQSLQRAIKMALHEAGIPKHGSVQTLRIPSPHIYWSAEAISEQYKSSWATPMCGLQ